MYDLIIIGSGPAGLGAAVYADHAGLNTLVIEKAMMSGGQVLTTTSVNNYPGFPEIDSFELADKLRAHAEKGAAAFVTDEVLSVELSGVVKTVNCRQNTYEARTIIIAAGAHHRKLGVPGEERLSGRGVSYCAVCDGAFFRNREVAVVGGGNIAIEDAIYLSRFCRKVWLIHRRDELRGAGSLQEQLKNCGNVEILWSTVVEEICGDAVVEGVKLKNLPQNREELLPVQGVFIAVGVSANSEAFLGQVEAKDGFLLAGEDCRTNLPGVFAAGDVRTTPLRQIVTAVADGANAVASAEQYLRTALQDGFAPAGEGIANRNKR